MAPKLTKKNVEPYFLADKMPIAYLECPDFSKPRALQKKFWLWLLITTFTIIPLLVCFFYLIGSTPQEQVDNAQAGFWIACFVVFVLLVFLAFRQPRQQVILYEEGIGGGMSGMKSDNPGAWFQPWHQLTEVSINRGTDKDNNGKMVTTQFCYIRFNFVDGSSQEFPSYELKTYFVYPEEFGHLGMINAKGLVASKDFLSILYVILRRSYKAKWTGDVLVNDLLK